jgi:hypothetical protein
MFTYVKRRVLDDETAARVERRALAGHFDLGWHWVDVAGRSLTSACGTHVDYFSQWLRDAYGRELHMCSGCTAAMPTAGDRPLDEVPELMSTTETASLLKISRQAVLQRPEQLGGRKIGDSVWVFHADTVRALATKRETDRRT